MECIKITNPDNASEMDRFQSVAHWVYRNDPIWAPASEMLWAQRFKQLHNDHRAFVLPIVMVEKDQPVARCMLQLIPGVTDEQGDPQAWIGFFECGEGFQEAAGAMLACAEKILIQRGARTVLISKSDNQMQGILTSGFDLPHVVFTNHNPTYYFDLLKSFGYVPKSRMITLYFTRENTRRFSLRLPGLRTREFHRENLDQEIKVFHTLQRKIFEGRPGYVPRTYQEDYQMVHSFLPFLEDKFVIIAETTSGTPVGLLICIPDLYQHKQGEEVNRARIISIGAIPAYTYKGVGALMGAHLMNNLLENAKYVSVEASWILSHNRPPQNLARRFNALPGKEYWLLEKSL